MELTYEPTPRIRKVFLDLDGVIADVVAGLFARHGRKDFPWRSEWPVGRYGNVHELLGLSARKCWDLGEGFWANLPTTFDGGLIHSALAERCGEDVPIYFLTKPIVIVEDDRRVYLLGCQDGKREWVRRRFGDDGVSRLILAEQKEACAGPGCLLVDDAEYQCKAFAAAGGEVIMYPRPWNPHHLHGSDPYTWFVRQLGMFQFYKSLGK